MNETIQLILVMLVSLPTVGALLLLLTILIPGPVSRAQNVVSQRSRRSFIVGLVNLLFFTILAAVLSNGGDFGGLLALLVILAVISVAAIGLSGMMQLLRLRMYPPDQATTVSPLQTAVRAALLLLLAMLTPIIGWFVLTPILLAVGLGAGIMAIVQRNKATQ